MLSQLTVSIDHSFLLALDAGIEQKSFRLGGSGCSRNLLVGISSLASLQPIATQAAYCASKAGFSMYLDSARIELKRKGIAITDILPGYIKTDIVEGVDIGKLPFAIPVEQAAREMTRPIEKRVKSGVVPAFPWKIFAAVFRAPPRALHASPEAD
jgi:short-subunit dehydrogenase